MNQGEQWTRARDLFLDLADLGDEERAAALAALVRQDAALGAYVERLLAQDAGPSAPRVARGGPALATGEPPACIGPYTLLDKLGEGGFGAVYRARQESPIVREVALKVQKAGLDSPQLLARFADERRYLARIDHPDVVKVLDAGALDDGRLYIAMELVRGEPITEFVAKHRPTCEERVALLARVARAVHHVHQRAIVHRDLKPSNILVARIDGEVRPRLIDFGIATAVSNTDRAGWTRIAGPMCTPGYAAPEQVAGSENVDVRADIYALGCVLCECLTGQRPREATGASETPVRRPSKLVTEGDAPTMLPRALSGDLDRIVLKCVAWEPDERYDSAGALALDLERTLRHEPILATLPTPWYLLRKFARRNRLAVSIGVLALFATTSGLLAALNSQRQAQRERVAALAARDAAHDSAVRASAVTTYLLEDLVQRMDIDARPDQPMTLTEVLEAAESGARERFAEDPATQSAVLALVGASYTKVGRIDDAERALRAAIEAAGLAYGNPSREAFDLRLRLLDLLSFNVRRSFADELKVAESDARALFRPGDPALLRLEQRTYPESERLEAIIAIYERDPDAHQEDLHLALRMLAERRRFAGETQLAIATLRKLRRITSARLGPDHTTTIEVTGSLGRTLLATDSKEEAMLHLGDAYERATRILGPDHETTRLAQRDYARALARLGRVEEALTLALDECARTERAVGAESIQHTGSLGYLAQHYMLIGQFHEAERIQREVLRLREAQWSPKNLMRLSALQDLAGTLVELGQVDEALQLTEAAYGHAERGSWRALQIAEVRARALLRGGRDREAFEVIDEAVLAGREREQPQSDLAPLLDLRLQRSP